MKKLVKNISFENKFGQMLMIGLDVYDINDEIIELIEKYKIGGVILYKKNYTSIEKMVEVINKLKRINRKNDIPLFIGIDQENGRVNRLPKEINTISSPYKQAKAKNIKIIELINEITTYILKSVGVNINFAPVLDINRDIKNKALGDRCYGDTFEEVIKYGIPFMKCMQKNNIISVAKHFPGHGNTNQDTHITIPLIKNINENDLKVFEWSIKENASAIMVGHLRIKGYGLKPASINKKIIQEKLINKYNYNGLIISDDLRMGIIKYLFGLKKSIINAVLAGNDIIIIKYKKGDISRIYKDLYKKVRNYEIDIEKINNSYKKIINIKKKYKINDNEISNSLDISLINKKIKGINDLIDKEDSVKSFMEN